MSINTKNYAFVRKKLLNKEEIALLDVREEDPHAQEHPLFAVSYTHLTLPTILRV